jgi:hypothetical protein
MLSFAHRNDIEKFNTTLTKFLHAVLILYFREIIIMEKKLEQFAEKQFLNLETFRKSGVGVPTPVWFAERNGNLYVRTIDNSGKVKRIRNNGRVRVAPCDARGMLEGEWVEAQARLVEGEIASIANALLDKKYGFQKKMFDLIASLRKNKHAIIEIQFD